MTISIKMVIEFKPKKGNDEIVTKIRKDIETTFKVKYKGAQTLRVVPVGDDNNYDSVQFMFHIGGFLTWDSGEPINFVFLVDRILGYLNIDKWKKSWLSPLLEDILLFKLIGDEGHAVTRFIPEEDKDNFIEHMLLSKSGLGGEVNLKDGRTFKWKIEGKADKG